MNPSRKLIGRNRAISQALAAKGVDGGASFVESLESRTLLSIAPATHWPAHAGHTTARHGAAGNASTRHTSVGRDAAAVTPNSALVAGTGTGLTGQYYNDESFGTPTTTRVDPMVNFNFGTSSPAAGVSGQTFSVRWSGQVQPSYSETYTFYLASQGADQLIVNGQQVVSDLYTHTAVQEASGTITLMAGKRYNIQIDYFQQNGAASDKLSWSSASQAKQVIPTSQLFPGVAVTNAASAGVTAGAGTTDPSEHQLVRTSGNVLYVFANGSTAYPTNSGSHLHVYKAQQAGTASSFTEVDAAHAPGNEVFTVDSAIDGSDIVHVVWNNRLGEVNYAIFDTKTNLWGAVTKLAVNNWTDFNQGDQGVNIALDANGKSHVVWTYKDNGGTLHTDYANNVGGTWNAPVRVDDITLKNAIHPTLAFAPNGDLLLAWIDGTGNYSGDGIVRTRVRHANGSWDASQAINDTAYAGLDNGPSLLITSNGTQHLTFNNNQNQIRYWYNSGSGWKGDRQPAVEETHDPVLGPDGNGGLYIYGHGAPADGSQGGFGPDKFRFHLAAGGTSWGPWTRIETGPMDDASGVRWSQFFFNFPKTVDYASWYDNYGNTGATNVPYTLYISTEGAIGVPANPTGLGTSAVGAHQLTLNWTAPAGSVSGYNVYRGTLSGGQSTTPINIAPITTNTFTDTGLTAGTTYWYYVEAINAAGTSDASAEVSAITAADSMLPAGWTDIDINAPAKKGSATFDGTTWTVAGGGADIYGKADQFNFANETVSGSQTILAKVTGITNTNAWAKAGVMFRDSTAPGSIFADVVATEAQGVSFQWRSVTGGSASRTTVAGIPAPSPAKPIWVKLVKSSNTFTAFYSTNGSSYMQIGVGQSFAFTSNNFLAGLAVTAKNNTKLNTATFTDVTVTAPVQPGTSIFTTQTPEMPDASDGVSYELGTKFQSSAGGAISAIRYYKSPSETGTHIGRIWDATGHQLRSVTFTNETASGWQTANLSLPLTILDHVTYVVTVNANTHFADTHNGLANSISNNPLYTVADGNDGVYGTAGLFPTKSYQNSNYFRDVVFVPREA